ncbi:MAG TPA: hypothetical protein VFX59_25840 [Polyangiales bacterium]|nr:hypothetical protein [Polyangiales bacterium]
MIQQSTYLDLLACAVGATNGAHRRAACALLAREHVTRLGSSARQRQPVGASHPVFADVPGSDLSLAQLMLATKTADDALAAARYLARCDREFAGGGAAYVQSEAPQVTASATAAQSNANALTPDLRALVVADIGLSAFAAARAPFAEHLDAFETVAYASFGVLADAAAGAAFRLNAHWAGRADSDSIAVNPATGRELFVPTGTTLRVNLHAVARSDGTNNPQSIALAIYVGETAARTYTATRASSNAAEFVEVGDFREFFRPGQSDTIAVGLGQRVSVRNVGASVQVVGGILTIWQP